MAPLNRRVLLIVGGGIAAYKALELARLLVRGGYAVTSVLTENGARFVTPLSLQALTGNRVYSDLWSLTDESEMGHIELSREADLLVVAPATADLLARLAGGLAPDLASTVLLATDKPVVVAPAMNVRMWQHPATAANVALIRSRGVAFVGPDEGVMACNEFGPGRLAEPPAIMAAIDAFFAPQARLPGAPLDGRHILVTAGPTREPIDAVRYIANRSSGRQGYAIADALAALGARITLVSGPTALPSPSAARVHRVETAAEMLAACQAALPADAAVFAAAVADWAPVRAAAGKLKKDRGPPGLALEATPDILALLSAPGPQRPLLTIGFAAETDDLLQNAAAKRLRKGCDWIVANDVSTGAGVMGGENNTVHILDATGQEDWPLMAKEAVAARLAERIAGALARHSEGRF